MYVVNTPETSLERKRLLAACSVVDDIFCTGCVAYVQHWAENAIISAVADMQHCSSA